MSETNSLGELDKPKLENHFKEDMGCDRFKPYQYEVISHMLKGEDTIAIMPTGSGKSACFQFVAKHLEGMTIVVEPIVALMRDQVRRAKELHIKAEQISDLDQIVPELIMDKKILFLSPEILVHPKFGRSIKKNAITVSMLVADEAHCIPIWGSSFRPAFLRIADFYKIIGGRPKLVAAFTATATQAIKNSIKAVLDMKRPFDLEKYIFEKNNSAAELFERRNILMRVKTIEKKEYDQEYWRITKDLLDPGRKPVTTIQTYKKLSRIFTAVFPREYAPRKKYDEIGASSDRVVMRWKKLRDHFDKMIAGAPKEKQRRNKLYWTYRDLAIQEYIRYRRTSLDHAMVNDKIDHLVNDILSAEKIKDDNGNYYGKDCRTVVYCSYIKTVNELYRKLLNNEKLRSEGIMICRYHAGLSNDEKLKQQKLFEEKDASGSSKKHRVMIATIAYGMGIDISNIRLVINFEMPKDIETYYQEIGRAGRDNNKAHSILYYYLPDIERYEERYDLYSNNKNIERMLERLKNNKGFQKLVKMKELVEGSENNEISVEKVVDYFLNYDEEEIVLPSELPRTLDINVSMPAYKISRGSYTPGKNCDCYSNKKDERQYGCKFSIKDKKLDHMDIMIANAVYSLGTRGYSKISPKDIFYMLTGHEAKDPDIDTINAISDRVRVMMKTQIILTVDDKDKYEGAFLPVTEKDDEAGVFNYEKVPPLYRYAEEHNSFFSVDLSWLDIKQFKQGKAIEIIKDSIESIKLRTFIAWRVHLLPKYRTQANGKSFNRIRFKYKNEGEKGDKKECIGGSRQGMYSILGILDNRYEEVCGIVGKILDHYTNIGVIEGYSWITNKKTGEIEGVQLDKLSDKCKGLPEDTLFMKDRQLSKVKGSNRTIFDLMIYGAKYQLDRCGEHDPSTKHLVAMITGNDELPASGQLRAATLESLERIKKDDQIQWKGTVKIPRKWLNVVGPSDSRIAPVTLENLELRMYIAWRVALARELGEKELLLSLSGEDSILAELGGANIRDRRNRTHSYEDRLKRMIPSILRHLQRCEAIVGYKLEKEKATKTLSGYKISL